MTTPLSEVKRHDPLGLLREAMAHVGPASQTLAAVRKLAHKSGQTFASVKVIADAACLSPRTCERHLQQLVQYNWLDHLGRKGRRTPTYKIDADLLNQNSAMKFALLPRWAALLLPTWAERAVFALVVSRDTLNEQIGGDSEGDAFGRLQYPVTTLAKDSGLSRRSISLAKAQLMQRGLLKVDPAVWWRDDLGRCRTMADTLLLNLDFAVPEYLIHRSANMADNRSAKVADWKGNGRVHRVLEVADTPRKYGGCGSANMADTQRKNGGCSDSQLLNQPLKSILTRTAEPASTPARAGCVGVEDEEKKVKDQDQENQDRMEQQKREQIAAIDIQERKRIIAEGLRSLGA